MGGRASRRGVGAAHLPPLRGELSSNSAHPKPAERRARTNPGRASFRPASITGANPHDQRRPGRTRHQTLRRPHGGAGSQHGGAGRRHLRVAGAQRRREEHHDPDDPQHPDARRGADHPVQRRDGEPRPLGADRVPPRGARALQEDAGRGPPHLPRRSEGHRAGGCAAEGPGLARPAGDRRLDDEEGGGPFQGDAAEGPVHRGPAARSRPRPPRRAVQRARSGEQPGDEGRGGRDRPERQDGAVLDPHHGAGRADVRPHRDHRPGAEGGRRFAGGGEARVRRAARGAHVHPERRPRV